MNMTKWNKNSGSSESGQRSAFTLIELLTVISIIGILAGMIVGLAPAATRRMKLSRVQGDLGHLVTAIESYKAKMGFYPPDNVVSQSPLIVNDATNQLYYELTGWVYSSANTTAANPLARNGVFYTETAKQFFNTRTFANSAPSNDFSRVQSFMPNVPEKNLIGIPVNSPKVSLFQVPIPKPNINEINVWHYRSTQPTNNPGRFDLWAEIYVGNEMRIIGNWK